MQKIRKVLWAMVKIYAFLDMLIFAIIGIGEFLRRWMDDKHEPTWGVCVNVLYTLFDDAYDGYKKWLNAGKNLFV